jgi:glycosyltransferase involved in cell wall biosynthesis
MDNSSQIFVVIPAYNESKVIEATLKPLIEKGYSVIVVDDGSPDETWSIIKKLPIYALHHRINLGQGAALQTGVSFALHQHAKIIVHFDADGQHNPDDIPRLCEPILKHEADVVLGSRFLRADSRAAVPRSRRIILKGAVIINGLLTGVWLSDAHNGFRAFSAEAASKVKLTENGFAHASEILMMLREQHLKYIEVPTLIRYTDYSVAKGQSTWNALNILIDLIVRRFL